MSIEACVTERPALSGKKRNSITGYKQLQGRNVIRSREDVRTYLAATVRRAGYPRYIVTVSFPLIYLAPRVYPRSLQTFSPPRFGHIHRRVFQRGEPIGMYDE